MRISLNINSITIQQNNFFNNKIFNPIPNEYSRDYYAYLKILLEHELELIQHIIKFGNNVIFPPIAPPIDEMLFRRYFSGFNLKYVGIKNPSQPNFEGYFDYNNGDPTIIYNLNKPYKRQRYTKTHETIHFIQSIDQEFLEIFDEAILKLPPAIIKRLLNRITERATAVYLMPADLFKKQVLEEQRTIRELSDSFQVSEQSIIYRLKELGLVYAYN